jgi:hypothetical protein
MRLKNNKWDAESSKENRFALALKNREDRENRENREIMVSDLTMNRKEKPDFMFSQGTAQQHWEFQVNKLMDEDFFNVSALNPDLLEKYIVVQAGKFPREYCAHQPVMLPLIILPASVPGSGNRLLPPISWPD